MDLNKLDEELEEATIDKAELFDFYNANWSKLIGEIQKLRSQLTETSGRCQDCKNLYASAAHQEKCYHES